MATDGTSNTVMVGEVVHTKDVAIFNGFEVVNTTSLDGTSYGSDVDGRDFLYWQRGTTPLESQTITLIYSDSNPPSATAGYEDCFIADSFGFGVEREMKESGEKGGTDDLLIGGHTEVIPGLPMTEALGEEATMEDVPMFWVLTANARPDVNPDDDTDLLFSAVDVVGVPATMAEYGVLIWN